MRYNRTARAGRVLAALGALVGSLVPGGLLACTCGQQSVPEARASADIVFAGAVEKVTLIDDPKAFEPRVIVQFRVAKVWKGDVGRSFLMHSNVEFSSCGGFFGEFLKKDKALLVYGFGRKARQWKTNGVDGAPNAYSLTVMPRGGKVLRADLLKATPDSRTVYTTNICSRTQPIEDAGEDLEQLGTAQVR